MGLFSKGAGEGIAAAATGIGDAVGGVARVFTVGKDARDQRTFDSYDSARKLVPQSWLGSQIRPLVTLVALSTFLMLNVIVCILSYLAVIEYVDGLMTFEQLVARIALIFTLFNAPGILYYTFVGTIMTYWFGGQAQKYAHAHQKSLELARTMPRPADAPATPSSGFVDLIGDDLDQLTPRQKRRKKRREKR